MRYLAYGSNLCSTQMGERCPAATVAETVELRGWRFIINRRGYATIVPDDAARVFGLIWNLTPTCEADLDDYEGVSSRLYDHAEIIAGGAPALVYLAASRTPGRPRPGYLEGILQAVDNLGLDPGYRREIAGWHDGKPVPQAGGDTAGSGRHLPVLRGDQQVVVRCLQRWRRQDLDTGSPGE